MRTERASLKLLQTMSAGGNRLQTSKFKLSIVKWIQTYREMD